ncbi:MAG: D-TA family PLP-dependent enzyme [Verrucomicrobiota bacterium]
MSAWYQLENVADVPSPSLLIYPDRIEANIQRMLELVNGNAVRLRPHVKTHKMAEIIKMQLAAGITKFKCATIAEMEMTATAGAEDVLLAFQPVGPNIDRLRQLQEKFPETKISAVVDDEGILKQISDANFGARLFVDVDCGMHRSGISVEDTFALCQAIDTAAGVEFIGLHVYDGHNHAPDPGEREGQFDGAIDPVRQLLERLDAEGPQQQENVGGGSPTFGFHASKAPWSCSPGTTLLWDAGYGTKFGDLGFKQAAVLLSRVISKPGPDHVCTDLGHKAVAGENPIENRVRFFDLSEDAKPVMQSEEHLVYQMADRSSVAVGQELYGLPWHICPTVALHEEAIICRDGRATDERWSIASRKRKITI